MATPGSLQDLLARRGVDGGVFWVDDREVVLFDPTAARQVNAANYADQTLPDRLVNLARGRPTPHVSWTSVRAAWAPRMRQLCGPGQVDDLATRMVRLLDARLDRHTDLVLLAHEVCTFALAPAIVTGLTGRDADLVLADLSSNFHALADTTSTGPSLTTALRGTLVELRSSRVIRREVIGRARGRRARRMDLIDPIVDMLPTLGLDRTVDACTAPLTAIAGPPGAVAACLLYALMREPGWAQRLRTELSGVAPADLHAGAAPLTSRFIKETLRMWSPPLVFARPVRTPITAAGLTLRPGQRYLISPYALHHDGDRWSDPDVFDPDRWLPDHPGGPSTGDSYVPFGWQPKACVGAGLATIQMAVFCHLMCTRYQALVAEPDAIRIHLGATARPVPFTGRVVRRAA